MIDAQIYLLAAGRGTRAGGPKAWLEYAGKPLLERQLSFARGLCGVARLAVTVQEPWLVRCRALEPAAIWVAVDPDAPALMSLQAALKALPLAQPSFLYHVDMPLWDPELFYTLRQRADYPEHAELDAIVPVHAGRGGHPVLLLPRAAADLARLDPARDRLDLWLRGRKVLRSEVPFPCVLENWNAGIP